MKTLALLFALLFALPAQAQDARRPTEAAIVASYESEAIAKARQRPDVIRLRFALAKATGEERQTISAALYAILEAAAAHGRQAGLAAVEASRQSDEALHRKWDEDRRHREMIQAINNLNIRR